MRQEQNRDQIQLITSIIDTQKQWQQQHHQRESQMMEVLYHRPELRERVIQYREIEYRHQERMLQMRCLPLLFSLESRVNQLALNDNDDDDDDDDEDDAYSPSRAVMIRRRPK